MENIENNESNSNKIDLNWYYIDPEKKEPKGPFSERDLDVFIRTNVIDSYTYVWKEGLLEWKKIYQIDELNHIVNASHSEIQESLIKSRIQNAFNTQGTNSNSNERFENYYFGADGYWHVYNPITKQWANQESKPHKIINKFKEYEDELDEDIVKEKHNIHFKKENNEKLSETDITPPLKIIDKKHSSEDIKIENDVQNNEESQNKFQSGKKRKLGENIEKILTEDQINELNKKKKKIEKQKEKKKKEWYTPRVNSNIYVSGLPKDITEQDLVEFFSRCGFIRKDPKNNSYKIKIYKDSQGKNKGDALLSFLREESVLMAIDLLNDADIKPGHKIKIEKAKFEQKGNSYKIREAYKLDMLQRYKSKTDVDRMLGWEEEDEEKGLKIVVLKNMFEPEEFYQDEGLRQDLELDIIEECEHNYGQVDKFHIYEDNPSGVIKLKFHTPNSAEKCIANLNGRYYNGKCIEALYWDGKSDYNKFSEEIETQDKRTEEFGQWLEKADNKPKSN